MNVKKTRIERDVESYLRNSPDDEELEGTLYPVPYAVPARGSASATPRRRRTPQGSRTTGRPGSGASKSARARSMTMKKASLSVAVAAAKKAGGRYIETRQGAVSLEDFAKLPTRRFPRGVVSYEYTAPAAIDRTFGTHGSIQMINQQGNMVARANVLKKAATKTTRKATKARSTRAGARTGAGKATKATKASGATRTRATTRTRAKASGATRTKARTKKIVDSLALVREAIRKTPPPTYNRRGNLSASAERLATGGVFVSALHRRVGKKLGLTLPEFKSWLLAQMREGNLAMTRADLVDIMPPRTVEDSEIRHLGSTFHFVHDPTDPTDLSM